MSGDRVIFTVRVDAAESVFLVGSFNAWSETNPLEMMSENVWQTSLSVDGIKDGDSYKFKVRLKGEEIYLADPCAPEYDGAPYHNSVYRDMQIGKVCPLEIKCGEQCLPVNIFSVRADEFYDRREHTYKSREIIPYMMQMGFTHLCISEIFEEYFDFALSMTIKGSFAPKRELGGIEKLREMISVMHKFGIGVLLDCGDSDMRDGNAKYWLEFYGFDGIMSSADFDGVRETLFGACQAQRGECERSYCNLQNAMSSMSYLLVSSGVGYAGARLSSNGVRYLDGLLSEKDESVFELFLSDLNALYLTESCLWRDNGERFKDEFGGALIAKCQDDEKIVIFAADTTGQGCEIYFPTSESLRVALDSHSQRYGGEIRMPRKIGDRLRLDPYQSVILIGEKP